MNASMKQQAFVKPDCVSAIFNR